MVQHLFLLLLLLLLLGLWPCVGPGSSCHTLAAGNLKHTHVLFAAAAAVVAAGGAVAVAGCAAAGRTAAAGDDDDDDDDDDTPASVWSLETSQLQSQSWLEEG
jgi:hypothetical protein